QAQDKACSSLRATCCCRTTRNSTDQSLYWDASPQQVRRGSTALCARHRLTHLSPITRGLCTTRARCTTLCASLLDWTVLSGWTACGCRCFDQAWSRESENAGER